MDTLSVNGLEVWTRVGCTAEERAFPQRLDLSLTLELPLSAAGASDEISRTVDYAALTRRVAEKVGRTTFRLIEAVAEEAARIALSDRRVRAVTVRVEKRALPGIENAAVEIRRAGARRR